MIIKSGILLVWRRFVSFVAMERNMEKTSKEQPFLRKYHQYYRQEQGRYNIYIYGISCDKYFVGLL